MKVAIATNGNKVAEHFGRCPEYTLVTLEDGKVKEQVTIANPGHEPGFLPEFLAKKGVNLIVAGGMGPRAQGLFASKGIETCLGVAGTIREIIEELATGRLQSGESLCSHGRGNCDHH